MLPGSREKRLDCLYVIHFMFLSYAQSLYFLEELYREAILTLYPSNLALYAAPRYLPIKFANGTSLSSEE